VVTSTSIDDLDDHPEPQDNGRRVRKATERGLYTDNPLHRAQKKSTRAPAPSKNKRTSVTGGKTKKRRVERVLLTDEDTEPNSENEASTLGVRRSVSPQRAAVEGLDIEVISSDSESSSEKVDESPEAEMSNLPFFSSLPI
jgi:hypothetical protein